LKEKTDRAHAVGKKARHAIEAEVVRGATQEFVLYIIGGMLCDLPTVGNVMVALAFYNGVNEAAAKEGAARGKALADASLVARGKAASCKEAKGNRASMERTLHTTVSMIHELE
jgi:hypothetical protein